MSKQLMILRELSKQGILPVLKKDAQIIVIGNHIRVCIFGGPYHRRPITYRTLGTFEIQGDEVVLTMKRCTESVFGQFIEFEDGFFEYTTQEPVEGEFTYEETTPIQGLTKKGKSFEMPNYRRVQVTRPVIKTSPTRVPKLYPQGFK